MKIEIVGESHIYIDQVRRGLIHTSGVWPHLWAIHFDRCMFNVGDTGVAAMYVHKDHSKHDAVVIAFTEARLGGVLGTQWMT